MVTSVWRRKRSTAKTSSILWQCSTKYAMTSGAAYYNLPLSTYGSSTSRNSPLRSTEVKLQYTSPNEKISPICWYAELNIHTHKHLEMAMVKVDPTIGCNWRGRTSAITISINNLLISLNHFSSGAFSIARCTYLSNNTTTHSSSSEIHLPVWNSGCFCNIASFRLEGRWLLHITV